MRRVGLEPRLEGLTDGLQNEETAIRIESAVIDLLGLGYQADSLALAPGSKRTYEGGVRAFLRSFRSS
jgi:hypothetical protein